MSAIEMFLGTSCLAYSDIIVLSCILNCHLVRWAWWDRELSGWLTTLIQCFDTAGRVIRPVEISSLRGLCRVGPMLNLFAVWLCSLSHEGGRSRRAAAAAVNYKEPTLGRQVLYVSHNNSPVLTCAYLVQQRSPVHTWFSNVYTWLDYTLTIFCWVGRVHWRLSWRTFLWFLDYAIFHDADWALK